VANVLLASIDDGLTHGHFTRQSRYLAVGADGFPLFVVPVVCGESGVANGSQFSDTTRWN
jgi:hypothetical protein